MFFMLKSRFAFIKPEVPGALSIRISSLESLMTSTSTTGNESQRLVIRRASRRILVAIPIENDIGKRVEAENPFA